MTNFKPKYFFIFLLILIIAIGIVVASQKKGISTITPWDNYSQQQTSSFSILETQDLNSSSPKFRINVQAHGTISQVPKKIFLVKKGTDTVYNELPLVVSLYPNECANHSDTDMAEMDHMQKWDTDWFTVSDLQVLDTSYESKLSDRFDIKLIYDDETAHDMVSTNLIGAVCYQVSESAMITPNPNEDSLLEQ